MSIAITDLRSAIIHAMHKLRLDDFNRGVSTAAQLPIREGLEEIWLPVAGLWEDLYQRHYFESTYEEFGRSIRMAIRALVPAGAVPDRVIWLAPVHPRSAIAAHICVLALSQLGVSARLWLWPSEVPGDSMLIDSTRDPFVTDVIGRLQSLATV